MMTPQFSDFLFTSAALLNGSAAQVAASDEDIVGSMFSPGLVNQAGITFSPSGIVVTVTFASNARVVFASGVLAGGYGNTNGVINGTYSVNLASLVPVTGSVTAYILASASQVGQQATLITGPSPGHPDYDPTFVPYTAYLETLDTITLTGTLTAPDNLTTFELCRVTLTSGEVTIPSVTTSHQVISNVFNLMGGAFPVTFNGVSSSGSIGSAYNGQFINVGGSATTQTLVAASTVPGMTVGFITSVSFTLASAGGNIYGASISTASIFVPVGGFICIQSDGTNWRIFSSSLASGFPSSSPSVSTSGSINIAYANAFVNVGGSATTQTLVAASTVPNMAVGFIADSAFTLASAGGNIFGPNISGTTLNMKVGDYICLQSDGTNWRIFASAPTCGFPAPVLAAIGGRYNTDGTIENWYFLDFGADEPEALYGPYNWAIPFEYAVMNIQVSTLTSNNTGSTNVGDNVMQISRFHEPTTTQFWLWNNDIAGGNSARGFYVRAIGY